MFILKSTLFAPCLLEIVVSCKSVGEAPLQLFLFLPPSLTVVPSPTSSFNCLHSKVQSANNNNNNDSKKKFTHIDWGNPLTTLGSILFYPTLPYSTLHYLALPYSASLFTVVYFNCIGGFFSPFSPLQECFAFGKYCALSAVQFCCIPSAEGSAIRCCIEK